MESWRHCFREGLAPILSDAALDALREALEGDDARLIQGATTIPPFSPGHLDAEVEAACALAFPLWEGDGLRTVGEVDEAWGRMCFEIDLRLGEPAGCRYLLNWYDTTPREEMRRALLAEIALERSRRLVAATA